MFDLSKWYGDCVSPSGDAMIAYSAHLRWGAISLHHDSVLEKHGMSVSYRQQTPQQWRWELRPGELRERIFESEDGSIDWHCVHPHANVETSTLQGVGYREHLHMTIAPWKLPIRELRWGRFLSASHTIVWIDWRGDFETRLVFRDGERVSGAAVDDRAISFGPASRLTLDAGFVLREGPLGVTVLSSIPVLKNTTPARMMAVNESKWLSRGRYEGEEAWAIHEVVRWP